MDMSTAPFVFSGESGIRTHAPKKDDRISSAARYDHFDISPYSIVCPQHPANHSCGNTTILYHNIPRIQELNRVCSGYSSTEGALRLLSRSLRKNELSILLHSSSRTPLVIST